MHKWEGNTQTRSFDVEFYQDVETENYVAKIQTESLSLWPENYGGPYREPKPKDRRCEELRDNDRDQLYERTKQQIVSHYGRILNFRQIDI